VERIFEFHPVLANMAARVAASLASPSQTTHAKAWTSFVWRMHLKSPNPQQLDMSVCAQFAISRCSSVEVGEKTVKRIGLVMAVMALGCLSWAGTAREDAAGRLDDAGKVLTGIMNAPDRGIPEEVLEGAKCIAVVPNMIKGGFILGGKHGKGVATCRTANGWSAPAFFTVGGGSAGLQIGVEGVDLVMIIQNVKGMERLIASKFEIGADASAAAGPVGRHASANTDWKADTEILTYSRANGAFAGATLEGASIRRDDDSTRAIYGRKASTRSILTGLVAIPAAADSFLKAVSAAKVAEAKLGP
jgi:lipid-binding SYLF domain-containing protein